MDSDGKAWQGTERVEQEALDRVVEHAESVGNIEPVVDWMQVLVEGPVLMYRTVEVVAQVVLRDL